MQVIAIGSKTFVAGFRLAGARGIEVSTPQEALQHINKLVQDPEVGLIIVSEDLSEQFRQQLNEIRAKKPVPLIYELPPPIAKPKRIDYRAMLREVLGV
ncbi:MAG: V-type ATP synthase subunit F [Aigarchaeota archaeon]|nr:V-type ATP synthase subunit F [Candidatus Pelearchaeum maunauluense]